MIEHREYVRLKESLKIGYKIIRPPDSQANTVSEDISGGGIRFPVKTRLVRGTLLDLKIYLPNNTEPLKASGEVVWSRMREDRNFPCVIGVKFANIDDFDRGKILNYIRSSIQEKSRPDFQWID